MGYDSGFSSLATSETYFTFAGVFGLPLILLGGMSLLADTSTLPVRGYYWSLVVSMVCSSLLLILVNALVLAGIILKIPR